MVDQGGGAGAADGDRGGEQWAWADIANPDRDKPVTTTELISTLTYRFAIRFGWDRRTIVHRTPWDELKELMAIDEEVQEREEEAASGLEPMPGTSTGDPLTYDPTQGTGTDVWQESVRRQKEMNANLERNASMRRN